MHPRSWSHTIDGIEQAGGLVEHDPNSDLLTVNSEFTASSVVVRCLPHPWIAPLDEYVSIPGYGRT